MRGPAGADVGDSRHRAGGDRPPGRHHADRPDDAQPDRRPAQEGAPGQRLGGARSAGQARLPDPERPAALSRRDAALGGGAAQRQ